MSNSGLVAFTKLSPNCTKPRKAKIDTITIHCVVGQVTAESLGAIFSTTSRQASSNYGVDKDGRIGLYVDEANRSWCSGGNDSKGNPIRVNGISGGDNDHRAVTIEVASDTTHPYAVNDKAFAALIELCVDICKRNSIKKLLWKADKSLVGQVDKQNMTAHRWFSTKSCPGDYLYNLYGKIANEVNKRLASAEQAARTPIMGAATATAEQMAAYLTGKNPATKDFAADYAALFLAEGANEGVRGDIAFAQSCLETGNFTFEGSAVTLDQNNFCGMGVTENSMKGNTFKIPQEGIRAQIQHLKAYGSTDTLKSLCADPRFSFVVRGSAEFVEWLGIQENPNKRGWAAGADYGGKILNILDKIIDTKTASEPPKIEYPDVSEWARDAWKWAVENGICDGLRPKDGATREEVITLLYRLNK